MKILLILVIVLIFIPVYGQEVDTSDWELSSVRCLTIHGDEGCPGLYD